MRKIIIASVLLFSVPCLGQKNHIGMQGGISWTNVYAEGVSGIENYRTGFTGGLNYTYLLENNFHFGLDFLYAQKGYNSDFVFNDYVDNTSEEITIYSYFDYFSFPLKAGYSLGNRLKGFLNLGVVPSLSINAEMKFPPNSSISMPGGGTYDMSSQVKKFDLGGLIEIGGSYKVQEQFLFFTSFAYQQSFTSFNKGVNSDQRINHYGMIVSLGIKYELKL